MKHSRLHSKVYWIEANSQVKCTYGQKPSNQSESKQGSKHSDQSKNLKVIRKVIKTGRNAVRWHHDIHAHGGGAARTQVRCLRIAKDGNKGSECI